MATQEGIIRISGKLGELVFYKRKQKEVVRKKAKPYILTEESVKSAKDFGEASRNAAYIRRAFAAGVKLYGDDNLINRLNKCVIELLKTAPKELHGSKRLIDGNLALLSGFEFNSYTTLSKLLLKPPVYTIMADGMLQISLTENKLNKIVRKIKAAHTAILQLMVFNFDLEGDAYEIFKINKLLLHFNKVDFPGAKLNIQTEQSGNKALILAVGISYLEGNTPIADRRYYACQIIDALHLKNGILQTFIGEAKPEIKLNEEQNGLNWEID